MREDYIEKRDKNAERRFTSPDIQIRDDGDISVVEGIAAVVDSVTDIGGRFMEKIARGAFDDVMEDDVVALFNHDPNLPLARTTATGSGHLKLFLNKRGDLAYSFEPPNTTAGRDAKENIRTKIISKSSFAFTIAKDEWETNRAGNEPDIRTILKFKRLYDISPVTYPAYNDTSVGARSLEEYQKPDEDYLKDKVARDKYFREIDLKKR